MGVEETVAELRHVIDLTDDARKLARDLRTVDLAAWERLDALLSSITVQGHHLAGQIAEQCQDCQATQLPPPQEVRTPRAARPMGGHVSVTWQEGNSYMLRCAVVRALPPAQGQRFTDLARVSCNNYAEIYRLAQRFVTLIP